MAQKRWKQVAVAVETEEKAEALSVELSKGPIKPTAARVLEAAVVVGLEEIERDPSRIVAPRRRKTG